MIDWRDSKVVGVVTNISPLYQGDNLYRVEVFAASYHGYGDETFQIVFKKTKQACWDFIERQFPGQLFYWDTKPPLTLPEPEPSIELTEANYVRIQLGHPPL